MAGPRVKHCLIIHFYSLSHPHAGTTMKFAVISLVQRFKNADTRVSLPLSHSTGVGLPPGVCGSEAGIPRAC